MEERCLSLAAGVGTLATQRCTSSQVAASYPGQNRGATHRDQRFAPRTSNAQPVHIVRVCLLARCDSAPDGADFHIPLCLSCAGIDRSIGVHLVRRSRVVHEVTGISSSAAAGALQAPGLHGAAAGRLCGLLVCWCRGRARTARAEGRLGEHARPRPSRARQQQLDAHILRALACTVSSVSHVYVTGDQYHV